MAFNQTEANRAYDILFNDIITGKIPLGTQISRRRMAEIAGTSVIPVTEALRRLEADGLMVTQARAGAMVAFPTENEMEGKYLFREAVECQIGEILCRNGLTRRQEETLRQMAQELDTETDETCHLYKHKEFHIQLAQYTEYQCFVDVYNSTSLYFLVCQAIRSRRMESPVPVDLHLRIVDAIMSGDTNQARQAIHDHIYDSHDYVMQDYVAMRQKAGIVDFIK